MHFTSLKAVDLLYKLEQKSVRPLTLLRNQDSKFNQNTFTYRYRCYVWM